MSVVVTLLQCFGVVGCRFPSSCKVHLIILASFLFRNIVPSSASVSDAATSLNIWHKVNISPLRCMGCLSFGFHPRKNVLKVCFLHIYLISKTYLSGILDSGIWVCYYVIKEFVDIFYILHRIVGLFASQCL